MVRVYASDMNGRKRQRHVNANEFTTWLIAAGMNIYTAHSYFCDYLHSGCNVRSEPCRPGSFVPFSLWLLLKYCRTAEQVASPPSGSTEAAAYWCSCLCSDCWLSTRCIEMSFLSLNLTSQTRNRRSSRRNTLLALSNTTIHFKCILAVKTKNKGNVLSREHCQNITMHCHSSITCHLMYDCILDDLYLQCFTLIMSSTLRHLLRHCLSVLIKKEMFNVSVGLPAIHD